MLPGRALLAFAAACWGPTGAPVASGLVLPGAADSSKPTALDMQEHELATATDAAAIGLHRQIPWERRNHKWSNVILYRGRKLAFCYVPKNACARMTSMFNRLNLLGIADSDFQSSTPKSLGVNMSEVTRENGWKFAYFTRDPLSRYASAFASKCVPGPEGIVEGEGADCGAVPVKVATDYLSGFERRAAQDSKAEKLFDNEHWRLQAEILTNCGWDKFNPDTADFIGDLSSGVDMDKQVMEMLKMVGMNNASASAVAHRFFPRKSLTGHYSMAHDRASLARFYRRPSVIKAVLGLYERDYKMLRIPKPLFSLLVNFTDRELMSYNAMDAGQR